MHNDHVNVTPLIDVVMCLIIFFLVCGRLAQQESGDTVIVPAAEVGKSVDPSTHRVVITVAPSPLHPPAAESEAPSSSATVPTERPLVTVNGAPMNFDAIEPYLKKAQSADAALQVVVRADEKTAYAWISPVLDACANANVQQVNFSTRE